MYIHVTWLLWWHKLRTFSLFIKIFGDADYKFDDSKVENDEDHYDNGDIFYALGKAGDNTDDTDDDDDTDGDDYVGDAAGVNDHDIDDDHDVVAADDDAEEEKNNDDDDDDDIGAGMMMMMMVVVTMIIMLMMMRRRRIMMILTTIRMNILTYDIVHNS
jgi:hypothetical protein